MSASQTRVQLGLCLKADTLPFYHDRVGEELHLAGELTQLRAQIEDVRWKRELERDARRTSSECDAAPIGGVEAIGSAAVVYGTYGRPSVASGTFWQCLLGTFGRSAPPSG